MSEPEAAAPQPANASRQQRKRISQADIPAISLEKALRVPRAIADSYGSDPTKPLDVGAALDMTPTSGTFRVLCGAAVGYGLTEGGPNAPLISLSVLGRRVVRPTEVDDDKWALREAAMKPSVAEKFYKKYDGSPLPPVHIAKNVLATLGVPHDRTQDVRDLLIENAEYVGFIKKIKDKNYIDIGIANGGGHVSSSSGYALDHDDDTEGNVDDLADVGNGEGHEQAPAAPAPAAQSPRPKNAIFLGHGSNRKPMDQLVKILNEYGIPHKQAVEEANRARPIPQKVAEVMGECGAAILVFTGDKEYFDREGNSIWRPSENVSHELGAASILYGDRIVIFKEKGIELPSNFSSVGYIEFEKDRLSEKGIELFRELVSMRILAISVS